MLGASDPQGVGQLNSYHHAAQLAAMNQMQGPVMNGVSGMHQVAQVCITESESSEEKKKIN